MDFIDKQIIRFLQNDAKMTIKEIASKLNLSTTPVFERIKKLEENNVITGYHAQINKSALNLELTVFCAISLKEHQHEYLMQFEKEINQLNEVLFCYHLGGNADYLLHIVVKNINAYHEFITLKLAIVQNIATVQSSFVMKEWKQGSLSIV